MKTQYIDNSPLASAPIEEQILISRIKGHMYIDSGCRHEWLFTLKYADDLILMLFNICKDDGMDYLPALEMMMIHIINSCSDALRTIFK